MKLTLDEKDYLNRQKALSEPIKFDRLDWYRQQRKLGVPHAYLAGSVNFFEVDLMVNSNCLIPRLETEILVEKLVAKIPNKAFVLDLCCGSGAIGLAIKHHRKDCEVVLSDISEKALSVASYNAKKNNLDVSIYQGDFFSAVACQTFDVIVCNPPYISHQEYGRLERSVKDFEPKIALTDGSDGLMFYRKLSKEICKYLNPGGLLALEIGYDQKESIKKIFHLGVGQEGVVEKDYSGNDRFFFLKKGNSF